MISGYFLVNQKIIKTNHLAIMFMIYVFIMLTCFWNILEEKFLYETMYQNINAVYNLKSNLANMNDSFNLRKEHLDNSPLEFRQTKKREWEHLESLRYR